MRNRNHTGKGAKPFHLGCALSLHLPIDGRVGTLNWPVSCFVSCLETLGQAKFQQSHLEAPCDVGKRGRLAIV